MFYLVVYANLISPLSSNQVISLFKFKFLAALCESNVTSIQRLYRCKANNSLRVQRACSQARLPKTLLTKFTAREIEVKHKKGIPRFYRNGKESEAEMCFFLSLVTVPEGLAKIDSSHIPLRF